MAGLFALLLFVLLFAWSGWRRTAIALFWINLYFSLLMLWHHMTDKLNINF